MNNQMSGLDGRFVSDLSDLSFGDSQETRHMGARKRSRFIIAGALLAIALLVCALVVLGVFYAAAIGGGGGGGENGTRIGSADKDTARNPLTLLFFEEKDDIDSITIQGNLFMAEFFLPDEALLWMNEAGDYIVQLKNKNFSIVQAEANNRITVVSSEKDEKDIVISAASLDRSLTVLKGMIHTRGDQFPKSLSRVRSDGARMTIATYYAGTTILTRKYEPELKLFLRHKRANSAAAAAAAADPQQKKLWEELLIRPETLHVSGVNSFGSFFFQEGKDVHVNSTADGNFSGSPFARKFGRVANQNATLEVVFAANDSCGRARLVGGADGGGELWLALAERAGGLRDASGRSALVLKDGALIEAHDGDETLRVHLHNATVDAKNAQDSGDGGANCSAPARTWHAPAASVAIERCASSRDSDDAPRRASNVTNAAGAIRVATNTLHNRYAFERGDGGALAECYADWHYAIIDAGAVGARLGCGHRMQLAPASLDERYAVEMSAGFFEINAAPARVSVSGSGATILAMSAKISIAPLKGAFE